MSTQIEGKVAAIIDDTTLVLNIGSEQGVVEGMVFAIFAAHGEIKDPDSGELLGNWELAKARVVATHVQPRMCTVRAPVIGEVSEAGNPRPLSSRMVEDSVSPARGAREWQRLEVRGADISGRPQNQPIAVGDGARAVSSSETPVDNRGEAEDATAVDNGGETGDATAAEDGGEAGDVTAAAASGEAGDATPA